VTRIALDTNILVYAEAIERSPRDKEKIDRSRQLMRGLLRAQTRPFVALQVLAEFHRVLIGKAGLAPDDAAARVRRTRAAAEIIATGLETFDAALDLATDHRLPIFDALVLAAAVEARCDLLASEDFQDGFAWRGVVVTNPFGGAPDRRLAPMLADAP